MNISRMHFIKPQHFLGLLIIIWSLSWSACSDPQNIGPAPVVETDQSEKLTIFFINDQHGELNNFSKIKHIVDGARDSLNVLLVCAGDMFSGNVIVDQYAEKGYPMIDVMNRTGFDVSVIGNHEFDYGQEFLKKRMAQAEFEWVCANLDVGETDLEQPDPFVTLNVGNLKVTILGLVETFGKPNAVIPATHPWRVLGLTFQRYLDVLGDYSDLKTETSADLLIALTHLGTESDRILASRIPELDLIIGGHSHEVINESVNGIPIVQSGANLQFLGRIDVKIDSQKVTDYHVKMIPLNSYPDKDESLKSVIDTYNEAPEFDEIVGFSNSFLNSTELGCFYTTALKDYLGTDCSFQNRGGIRAGIDQGEITKLEIYDMDPFNNNSVIFTMTVAEIKHFFQETRAGEHVTGITLQQDQDRLLIYDEAGREMQDQETITIGINDYIPAVYEDYFPLEKAQILDFTTAEAIINYLKTINNTLDYEGCNRYFDFQ